ncbi:MAG TPA: tetratricopeptide repeat protein [Roseiarcus sp.]|jgi:tetratricopeptide (TPR) repeat protein
MKTKEVCLVIIVVPLFLVGVHSSAAEITQTIGSGSWCSPAQNGNGNTVICNGVDPRAMDRLNELLDRKDLDLKQKTTEANAWAHRYNELNAQLEETKKQLAANGQDATLVQTAQDLLHEGKFKEARAIFDRLIQSDEANVDRAAQDYFGRATVFALQFRFDQALPDCAKAYEYRPNDQLYVETYAYALWQQKDFSKLEVVLQELLKQQRTLATQNPLASRLVIGSTLVHLGIAYDSMHRFDDAEVALKEAVEIQRELAAQYPAAYRPALVTALIDLGIHFRNTHGFDDAEAAIKEAIDIQRELAAQSPAAYRPDLATALNDLGNVYVNTHRFVDAATALEEAADIRRALATENPAAYRPGLATTLDSLGVLYMETNRFAEAEAAYNDAVIIQRRLAGQEPRCPPAKSRGDAQQPREPVHHHAPRRRCRSSLQRGHRPPSCAGRGEPSGVHARPRGNAQHPRFSL